MCHCTEYKLSALQIRISEENTFNAATQQFKNIRLRIKTNNGSKTHSLLRQCNLQLQNKAALMSVEYEQSSIKCAAGLAGVHESC